MAIVYQLINPPQDVTDALNALQTACAGWHQTPVEQHNPLFNLNQAAPKAPPPPTQANEATACLFIADPVGVELHDFEVALFPLGLVVLSVVGMAWACGLFRLPGWIIRKVRWLWFIVSPPRAVPHDESH